MCVRVCGRDLFLLFWGSPFCGRMTVQYTQRENNIYIYICIYITESDRASKRQTVVRGGR